MVIIVPLFLFSILLLSLISFCNCSFAQFLCSALSLLLVLHCVLSSHVTFVLIVLHTDGKVSEL